MEGDKRNNHSVIQCVAILYQDYQLLESKIIYMAVLIVLDTAPIAAEEDRVLPTRTQNYHQSSTVEIDVTQTLIALLEIHIQLIQFHAVLLLQWNKELVAGKVCSPACVPVLMLLKICSQCGRSVSTADSSARIPTHHQSTNVKVHVCR